MKAFQHSIVELFDKEISHVWFGHGSALFLELGKLTKAGLRKDGSNRNPKGEISIIVDFCWRIERKQSICLASGESKIKIDSSKKLLVGNTIIFAQAVGRLPELQLQFSNSLWLTTFSQYKGQPSWAILFNTKPRQAISVKNGKLHHEKLSA